MGEGHVAPHNPSGQTLYTGRSFSKCDRISPVDWLNHDPRLNFVLDLEHKPIGSHTPGLLAFCNSALLESAHLHGVIIRAFSQTNADVQREEDAFAAWVIDRVKQNAFRTPKAFFGILWTVALLPDSWAVISGLELAHCDLSNLDGSADEGGPPLQQDTTPQVPPGSSLSLDDSHLHSAPEAICVESVRQSKPLSPASGDVWPAAGQGGIAQLSWFRDFDWASTPLGPTETWPRQLKQACEMMLANPDPATVFWGPELLLVYNQAYIALAGNKHPAMMGGSARVHWKEVWDQYDPLFNQMFIDGIAFAQDNVQLFIQRRGYLEEGFFNLRVLPLFGDDRSVIGFYEPVAEVTRQTLAERRMHMLLKLSERTASETSLRGVWDRLLEVLSAHPSDVHFAMIYHLQRTSQPTSTPRYHRMGAIGLGAEGCGFPQTLVLDESDEDDVVSCFKRAHETGTLVVLTASDGTLSPAILEELDAAGITEAPRACIVCPLSSIPDESVEAILVIGSTPSRSYDEDYELFINLIVRQVEGTITSVKLLEKEKKQIRKQAAFDSELKFKKFAENSQVGIFSFDPQGNITFCNDSWLELSGHDRNDMSAMSWSDDVHPDNIEEIKNYWNKMINLEGPQTFEVQYKKPWRPSNLQDDSISLDRTWVVASAYAEVSEQGEVTGILGSVTDISSFKWVDQLQSQRLGEALELKRQQENFLDITSHEMRNPLNAILHCATELIEILPGLAQTTSDVERLDILRDCLDASRTIEYCGRHQKRIIDDVLTLSKMDSNLLSISPAETPPMDVVEEVLRIFDTEIRASGITAEIELAPSYKEMKIETLLVDPHRLLQILINLVANAIKFTKGEPLRSLHIMVGAQDTEPIGRDTGVRYVPSGRSPTDPTVHSEWGTGDAVFLHFSVQDTGPGMSRQEADLLFNRFAQASPRTHVQYGGFGLGLFISRELAESHGGRIGISSELGCGSTFDFYIKGRRPVRSEASERSNKTPKSKFLSARPLPKQRISSELLQTIMLPSRASHHVPQKSPSPSRIHVLVVEDNIINQKILAKLIRKRDWDVSVANHGEEALTEIKKSTWYLGTSPVGVPGLINLDIVLADIEMPIMDGKEFVQQVRRLQCEGLLADDIPVIAVTGNARSEQMKRAKDCGFDEVISKPYQEQDIISIVMRYTKGLA